MLVINKTISFAESVQKEGIEWIKNTYLPLLQSCHFVSKALFFSIDVHSDSDECFAIQIQFENISLYNSFVTTYEKEFEKILLLKFPNTIGIFKTILREL